MEQGAGQRPESICSLIYLVNEKQLNKQLDSHREGDSERVEGPGGRGSKERKLFFLCFVLPFPFLHKEEVEEEYPAPVHP